MTDPSGGSQQSVSINRADQEVALFIDNPKDRSLLAEQIDEPHVIEASPDEPLPEFDLCIVDTTLYPRIEEQLAARKEAVDPVYLPVLVVLRPNDSTQAAYSVTEVADDVLSVPSAKPVIEARIEALLQAREQAQRLQAQRQQLSLYQRALDQSQTGITIATADDDQPLIYANDAFAEITGYTEDEVVGRNCRFLQGEATDPETVAALHEAIEAGDHIETTIRNYRADGSEFWNWLEISPVYTDGELTHFLGFQQDVTEELALRDELREERDTLSRIFKASPIGIAVLDADGQFVRANERAEEILKIGGESLLEKDFDSPAWNVFDEQGEPFPEEELPFSQVLQTREPVLEFEHGIQRDGERRWLSINAAPIIDESDERELVGVVTVFQDITGQEEYERRLSVLDRVLRHNLRNKLNVILGQAALVEARTDDSAVLAALDQIQDAGEELLSIGNAVRRFNDTLHPDSGRTSEVKDLVSLTQTVVADIQDSSQSVQFVDAGEDPVWGRVHQLFRPLFTELIEAILERGDDSTAIRVSIQINDQRSEAVVSVSYEGVELPPVERAALQAGQESPLQHTTDIRLWLVRWMAVNSGGEMTIDAGSDEGTVDIHVPLGRP